MTKSIVVCAILAFIGVAPLASAAAPLNACTVIRPADIVGAVGSAPSGPGRLRTYPNDPASECLIPTSAGTIQASLFPGLGAKQMSAFRAGYQPLEAVAGVGDEAAYSKQHSTLGIRRGTSMVMLSLASPDAAQNRRILIALGKRASSNLP